MQTASLFGAEPGQPIAALHQRIAEIGDEARRQQAKEPAAPREEIILVTRIFLHLLGEQQARQQIVEEGIRPARRRTSRSATARSGSARIPATRNARSSSGSRPPRSDAPDRGCAAGMLDDPGDAREDAGEAEAQHHADDHADVEIDVVVADRVLPVPPRRCPRPSSGNPRLGDRG